MSSLIHQVNRACVIHRIITICPLNALVVDTKLFRDRSNLLIRASQSVY